MALELTPLEYNTFFVLTIILIAVKTTLAIFLGKKMYDRWKETGEFNFGFVFGVFVVVVCLLVSRLFYIQFDFILTKFDPNKFYLMPNVLIWKIASFIISFGYAVFVFIVDKKIFNFKLKGIIAYIVLFFGILLLIYPVDSAASFQIAASFALAANLVGIVIPAFFFYMGLKAPKFRKHCFTIAIGVILYAIGANITVESFLAALSTVFGLDIRIIFFFLSLIFKATGLTLFTYGVTKFVIEFSK